MSRELKFRCWDRVAELYLSNGNWTGINQDGNPWLAIEGKDVLGGPYRWVVEQYTGLKDKNGREIYEGDLIKVSDAPVIKDKTLVVEFGEYYIGEYACTKMSGWLVRVVNSDWTASLLDEVDRCEVIGNIHANAGLLQK